MARMYLPPSIPEDASEDQLFNPGDHRVEDVNAYLDTAGPDEAARVLEAEFEGKGREGILEGPHAAKAEEDDPDANKAFDPSEHKVEDVNDYLADADPDEVARVLAAESEGKARQGILEGPHAGTDQA